MENKLNALLGNLVVEYHKLQNFHWYVQGKEFFAVHAKLEDLYNYLNKAIDEVAENMLMLGQQPVASLKEFLEVATIEESLTKEHPTSSVYQTVLADFENILNQVKEIKGDADEKNIYLISSLMDGYIAEFSKTIWMLNQTNK